MKRRDFLIGAAGTALSTTQLRATPSKTRVRAAAIQYAPVLADVDANLAKCHKLALDAVREGARWIVLPEFFTSGLAMDKKMWRSYRPVDGEPTQFLKGIAKQHDVHIGGSFLAQSGDDVFNTFVLASPDGSVQSHDKDFPSTVFESSFYAGGEDQAYFVKIEKDGFETLASRIHGRKDNVVDGVLESNERKIGVALCWELVRYRTARRLREKVDLILAASGWWWGDPEFGWPGMTQDEVRESRDIQTTLIQKAPRLLARMTGAPVVHANFAGINRSYTSDHTFSKQLSGRYLGQSQIIDGTGTKVVMLDDSPGIAIGEIEIGDRQPSQPIPPDEFWLLSLPEGERRSWSESGARGRDFYLQTTRKKIAE